MFGERDNKFFSLFEKAADNIFHASQLLLELVNDPSQGEAKAGQLEELEHRGDELTHNIIAELNRAFITPLDREDIFQIAKEMDDIMDRIDATAQRYIMLNITNTTKEAQELARMIVQSAGELVKIMKSLRKIKLIATDNKYVVEINRIEDDGDKIYRRVVKELYSGKWNVLTIIKWREIYDHLEDSLDAIEDVANVVEGIAMKHT